MNMTFKIDIDRRKVEAIRCYMPDGNIEELLNEEITKAAEGETFVMEGRVNDVQDGATGLQLTNCPGGFRFPMRMFLTDYEIKNDQPVAWTMSAPKQLSAEPNKKYVSNHDMYMRRQAEMQAKKDN